MGVRFFLDVNDFAEDHPEIVVFSTSIISLEAVVLSFPFHRLRRSTLIVDVLSVKVLMIGVSCSRRSSGCVCSGVSQKPAAE